MIILKATDTLIQKESRSLGIVNFGDDNLYPNNSRILSNNSSALKRCVETYGSFIFGSGVSESGDFWKHKINFDGLRVDQFFRKIIKDEFAIHDAFAFIVGYNGLLQPSYLIPLPFETLRIPLPDDEGNVSKIRYYKDWSSSRINQKDIIDYDLYNTDIDVIQKQIEFAGGLEKWRGQIYYYGQNGEVKYPHNSFHSVLEDCITDLKIKQGKNANASTNFMPSHIIQFPFFFSEATPYGKELDPEGSRFRQDVMNSFSDFQGFDKTSKLMGIENPNVDKEGKMIPFKIDKLEASDFTSMFQNTELSVRKNIRENFVIPDVLIDVAKTGFSTDEMQNGYRFFNNITAPKRQIFEEVMLDIFSKWHKNINESNNYTITPLKAL